MRVRHGNATNLLTSSNGIFGTGLHVFWPLIGEIISQDTNIETPETGLQTLTSKDWKPVTISMAARYKVKDLKALYMKIHDQDATIEEEIRSAAGAVAFELDFTQMPKSLGLEVLKQLKSATRGWGIEIISISLINFTDAQVIRLMNGDG